MAIPLVDLRAQYQSIRSEIDQAVLEVLASGAYVQGPAVSRFEQRFAEWVGTRHCVTTNSGTSALHLSLLALGVGPGDEVICPAVSFIATAATIVYCGAQPVMVDIDPQTHCIDPGAVLDAITPKTKVILPVHLFGHPANMDALGSIAQDHQLAILEDAAQAHGSTWNGQKVGTFGDAAAFSFYPTKNLGAYGEGGAVCTNNDGLAEQLRALRDWAQPNIRGRHDQLGFNARMDTMQAAILDVKLNHIDAWTQARQKAAQAYTTQLRGVAPPTIAEGAEHAFHVYAVETESRDRLVEQLKAQGIGATVHYSRAMHQQPCFEGLGVQRGPLPNAEALTQKAVSLPMFPEISQAQIEAVCRAIATSR